MVLYTKGILRVYKGQVLWNMVVLSLSISHKIGIFLAHFKKKYYLCSRNDENKKIYNNSSVEQKYYDITYILF